MFPWCLVYICCYNYLFTKCDHNTAGDVPHHLPEVLDGVGQWSLCSYEPHTVGIVLLCNKRVMHDYMCLLACTYYLIEFMPTVPNQSSPRRGL